MRARESDAPMKQSETASRISPGRVLVLANFERQDGILSVRFESNAVERLGERSASNCGSKFSSCVQAMLRLCSEDELGTIPGIVWSRQYRWLEKKLLSSERCFANVCPNVNVVSLTTFVRSLFI